MINCHQPRLYKLFILIDITYISQKSNILHFYHYELTRILFPAMKKYSKDSNKNHKKQADLNFIHSLVLHIEKKLFTAYEKHIYTHYSLFLKSLKCFSDVSVQLNKEVTDKITQSNTGEM